MVSKLDTVSVIMPAFNVESVIEKSIKETSQSLGDLDITYEIIVVDDGSKDATRKVINSVNNKKIRILSYDQNRGKGFALTMGAINSLSKYVIFLDGDNEINTDLISKYLIGLKHADIVVGSKMHPESVIVTPVMRKFLSLGFNVLVRLMTGINHPDTQVGFKAFRREALVDIMKLVSVRNYAFDVELLTIANLLKMKIALMPIKIESTSMFSIRAIIRMLIDILGIAYRLRVKKWYQKNQKKKFPPSYKPIIRW